MISGMMLFERLLRGRRTGLADAAVGADSPDAGATMIGEMPAPDWETFGARVARQAGQLDDRLDLLRVQLQAYYRDQSVPTDLHGRTPFDRLSDLSGQLGEVRREASRAAPDFPSGDRAQKSAHRLTLRLAEIATSLDRMQAVMERRRSRPACRKPSARRRSGPGRQDAARHAGNPGDALG
ncbi:MAG: hypothetical protein R3E68_09050 [Burkholderiaceae bacterium]